MAIRKKLNHDTKTREKIQTSQIVNRLTKHIYGEVELSSTQVRAAEILLNKTLPNLQAIESTNEVIHKHVTELTSAELYRIAANGRTGDSETESSDRQLN